ncbi:pyridoxal phosphate-dependent aminotransferase [Streptomyces virginiae]|uniref:pyridoxal phosphate-dependent aminotransferase n=1 Tax=Streptomyces virginiae TaxID=1961 RepID=UPI0036EDA323
MPDQHGDPGREPLLRLSRRSSLISGSKTSGTRNKAEALRARGVDIVNFAAGELDFAPHPEVLSALRHTADADVHRYTDTGGIPALREALAERISRLSGVAYTPSEVLVTAGAKHALYLACLVLLDSGDEALVPNPGWGTFQAQIKLAGAVPVPVETADTGFVPTVERLDALRTPRTRMLVLNTPNNPTGAVYPPHVLAEITAWARQHGVWILFDECYGELVLPGARHAHPAALVDGARELVVGIGSFSKSFAVTGWRVGHVHGPAAVISAMKNLQSHTTSNVTSVVQHALLPAARGELDDFVAEARQVLLHRHGIVEKALAATAHLSATTPQGAFYFFVDGRDVIGRTLRGVEVTDGGVLAELLLEHAGIALTPGSAFGSEGFLRLSYAIAEDRITAGLTRLREVMDDVR